MDEIADSIPANFLIKLKQRLVSVPGKIDDQSLSNHQISRQESPIAAVCGVISVVTHHEEITLWDLDRTEIIAIAVFHIARDNLPFDIAPRVGDLAREFTVEGISERLAIDENLLVADFDGLSLSCDTPFDIGQVLIKWETKDDDVPLFWLGKAGKTEMRNEKSCLGERDSDPVW